MDTSIRLTLTRREHAQKEYGTYQKRKGIYAIDRSKSLDCEVKVEFEPVNRWDEITNGYETTKRIENLGRIEAVGEILSGEERGFMPSYVVVSYVVEFRLQLEAGETVLVRGDLGKVETREEEFYQITLSYGEDYFDHVLKAVGAPSYLEVHIHVA